MTVSEMYGKLTQLFSDLFDDDEIDLKPETSAEDIDGWDSLNHIRLMIEVQKAFKVKFSANEIGKLKNVGDLVDLLQKKM